MSAVHAVVLNWCGEADTRRAVASLREQDYADLSLLVVDNGSHDGSGERLAGELAPGEYLGLTENRGFAGGMNAGCEQAFKAGAEWVLLLNNDATLAPDALSRLMAFAGSDSRIALAVPTIRTGPGALWYAGGSISRWTAVTRHETRFVPQAPRAVSFATGCCWLLRKEAYQALGGLDPRYFLYFEDAAFCERLREAGWTLLYVPAAEAWHAAGAATGSGARKAPALDYYDVRNGLLFIRERRRGRARLTALAYFYAWRLPRKLLRLLVAGSWPGVRAVADGLRDAHAGRTGPRAGSGL